MGILLPDDLEEFIQSEVARGRYSTADETGSEAVQLLRPRE